MNCSQKYRIQVLMLVHRQLGIFDWISTQFHLVVCPECRQRVSRLAVATVWLRRNLSPPLATSRDHRNFKWPLTFLVFLALLFGTSGPAKTARHYIHSPPVDHCGRR